LVSNRGTFNVDRKAGLVQVTDFPDRLDRIGVYLDAVTDRVQRQVQIEARVVEVELNDEKATTLDWTDLKQTRDSEKVMGALAAQGT
jgi:Type II secretory pathway, component PulD